MKNRINSLKELNSLFLKGKVIMFADAIAAKDSKMLILMFRKHDILSIRENLKKLARKSKNVRKKYKKIESHLMEISEILLFKEKRFYLFEVILPILILGLIIIALQNPMLTLISSLTIIVLLVYHNRMERGMLIEKRNSLEALFETLGEDIVYFRYLTQELINYCAKNLTGKYGPLLLHFRDYDKTVYLGESKYKGIFKVFIKGIRS